MVLCGLRKYENEALIAIFLHFKHFVNHGYINKWL